MLTNEQAVSATAAHRSTTRSDHERPPRCASTSPVLRCRGAAIPPRRDQRAAADDSPPPYREKPCTPIACGRVPRRGVNAPPAAPHFARGKLHQFTRPLSIPISQRLWWQEGSIRSASAPTHSFHHAPRTRYGEGARATARAARSLGIDGPWRRIGTTSATDTGIRGRVLNIGRSGSHRGNGPTQMEWTDTVRADVAGVPIGVDRSWRP